MVERAAAAEDASASTVHGITNSEGAERRLRPFRPLTLATSAGFAGRRVPPARSHSISASGRLPVPAPICNATMTTMVPVYLADLDDPAVHRSSSAGGAGDCATQPDPAERPRNCRSLYDPRVAGGILVSHLSGAINGATVARGTSFLKDKLAPDASSRPASTFMTIHAVRRGARSRARSTPRERAHARTRLLVEDGILTTWLLDSRACPPAREWRSTGHAARGVGGPPSPSAWNQSVSRGGQR